MSRAHTIVVPVALATLLLAGCSDAGSPLDGAAVASGDPDACPGEVVDAVVSVGQWGDVVRQVAGDCANVTTIVASGTVDPHDFQAGTADLVDDEVLATFAVVAEPDDVAAGVRTRFDGLVDRFSVYASYPAPPDLWDPLVRAFR